MATFHRLTSPSYFGGLPGGYDLINVGAAVADVAKVGGPNEGTYWHAFGEDATSSNFNRPIRALSENCDLLDNLMRRDIALPVQTADLGPTVALTPTVTLTGPGVFLGLGGAVLKDLFHITDESGDDIDFLGTKIAVLSLVDAGGGFVGGGFSLGAVTLTLNVPIPIGMTFRIYYGQRTNLATLPLDALTKVNIRNTVGVDFETEELFRLLRGDGLPWNSEAWPTTIFDLGTSGLDDRYRHRAADTRTTPPEALLPDPLALDTPGAGSYYVRDGVGMAGYSTIFDIDGVYSDPLNALWKAKILDVIEAGSVGFVSYGRRRATTNVNENLYKAGFAGFLHVVEHAQAASIGTFRTNLMSGDACTIQLVGGLGVVTLTEPGHYFALLVGGALKSSIAAGIDFIEVNHDDGSGTVRRHTYLIHAVLDAMNLRVYDLTGRPPTFPPSVTPATLGSWLSTQFMIGDGSPSAHMLGFASSGLFHAALPPRSSGGIDTGPGGRCAELYAQDVSSVTTKPALAWGGFQADLTLGGPVYVPNAYLYGDGTLYAQGTTEASHITSVSGSGASSDVTVSLMPRTQILDCEYTGAAATMTVTFDVTKTAVTTGTTYTVLIKRHAGCTITSWIPVIAGVANIFSGLDQDLQFIPYGGLVFDFYRGYAVDSTTILWSVDRFES